MAARQRVDAAALVHTVAAHVSVMPHALRDSAHTRHDAVGHLRLDEDLAMVVKHANRVAGLDVTLGRIQRIDPDVVTMSVLNDLVVGVA